MGSSISNHSERTCSSVQLLAGEAYAGQAGPSTAVAAVHKTRTSEDSSDDFSRLSENTLRRYKLSIKQKYESEWSSLSALYNEPVIIQKNENGSFKNISVDTLLMSYGTMPVILQGNSGSGKSIIVQKIMLDWASEASNFFYVVFNLRCEELMCVSEEINLIELLSYSCSLTSDQISQMLQHSPEKMLFIIDGFDELRLTQAIFDMSANTDPLQKAPPEVILCSLLRRYLIPKSNLLVTTRTKNTLNKLLKGQTCFTEIMGFSEEKVETYLQCFSLYDRVRANETLLTACSIPVICQIVSELVRVRVGADVTSGLETTTSIYVDFVSTLLEHHCQSLSQSVLSLLRSLGQLAERGMLEQQVLFDEENVNKIFSDPDGNLFLCRFLSKRRIRHETMFTFMYHSFQEFFTALYYVLLDEEESQRKVMELLHTVERGWALSCCSDRDFSKAYVEVRQSKLLEPVILFLCGLCKKEWIPSFFEKHNMAVSVNIETQLKEWISMYSQRYQDELMLFILHCLYELHERKFIRKVLEKLVLIDLSNTPLKMTDCWVLKYCLQCCEHIRNLKLLVTSDNLKMLQPELYCCKELRLMMDHISDDVVGLVSAAAKGKILNKLSIKEFKNEEFGFRPKSSVSVSDGDIIIKEIKNEEFGFRPEISVSVSDGDIIFRLSFGTSMYGLSATELTLTSPCSFISTINWVNSQREIQLVRLIRFEQHEVRLLKSLLQSVSGLKKVCLQDPVLTETFTSEIPSLIQACPSLNELSINVRGHLKLEYTESMKTSLEKMGWTLTILGDLLLIKPCMKRFAEENLKTKQEKSESGRTLPQGKSSDSVSYSSTEDAEMFTPELRDDEDKLENTYRFVCAHAGQFQCSLTNLVFVMEGEGEVLYRVDSWDPRELDGLGQMQPAGPLYNIECFNDSLSGLHFPHCEILSETNKDILTVAHFTGGNVEMMKPLKVTESRVMIDIRHLSLFGLIKKIFSPSPVYVQVILLLRPIAPRQRENILDVHLLPWNIPLSKVKDQHRESTYITTSSMCVLTPGLEYSLCCQAEGSTVQPETARFECNFGPNYHPTFEVFVNLKTEKVRLSILERTEGKEVWFPRQIVLP